MLLPADRQASGAALPFIYIRALALFVAAALCICCSRANCANLPPAGSGTAEDDINLFCLKQAYPRISHLEDGGDGRRWLYLRDGRKVLYSGPQPEKGSLAGDVKTSMSQRYPLESERPETPPGTAPGRTRSYELLAALYGADVAGVSSQLVSVPFQGKQLSLAGDAARAMSRLIPSLPSGPRELLKPDGAFYWRKIAGENALSAHSFGIAVDIGASKAPYWRWSRKQPHPMQKTYPESIVRAFEDAGFIWGGKWHEYDLMHFEYRPELICKARLMRENRSQGRPRPAAPGHDPGRSPL